ncbi:MAG: DUF1987 domain-containing protein [Bacteroidetes bacterium]|nr:DUF1987 domain-containing protein [Bacteroidota bacterium]
MENFTHKGNFNEPDVNLDAGKGILEIKGRSILEHATEFYQPILEWVDNYAQNPETETTINYQLDYYNSSSKKYLLDILEKFTPLFKGGKKVTFNWYYKEDDDEEKDAGILYGELSELPVNLICIPDEQ